jgi:hypothetical protein
VELSLSYTLSLAIVEFPHPTGIFDSSARGPKAKTGAVALMTVMIGPQVWSRYGVVEIGKAATRNEI